VQALDTAFAGGPFAPEQTFTVTNGAVAAPRFIALTPQAGNLTLLEFNGTPGASYSLLMSTNLTQWTTLASATTGTNGLGQLTVTNAVPLPRQFFRLKYP